MRLKRHQTGGGPSDHITIALKYEIYLVALRVDSTTTTTKKLSGVFHWTVAAISSVGVWIPTKTNQSAQRSRMIPFQGKRDLSTKWPVHPQWLRWLVRSFGVRGERPICHAVCECRTVTAPAACRVDSLHGSLSDCVHIVFPKYLPVSENLTPRVQECLTIPVSLPPRVPGCLTIPVSLPPECRSVWQYPSLFPPILVSACVRDSHTITSSNRIRIIDSGFMFFREKNITNTTCRHSSNEVNETAQSEVQRTARHLYHRESFIYIQQTKSC